MKHLLFSTRYPQRVFAKLAQGNVSYGHLEAKKKHVSVVLSATADGTMLPPMLIFKEKTDKTIKKLRIPKGFIVKTQEKSWMDEVLMEVWVEEIWLKNVREVSKQLGFDNSLLTCDHFHLGKTWKIGSRRHTN